MAHISIEQIRELQLKDKYLLYIIAYLENNELPESQKIARKILLEATDYVLIDNILFHSRAAKSKRNTMMDSLQIVIPEGLVETVLKVVHDSPLGGHCGINNTLDRAKEHFFFPRMGKIISEYVKTCHTCQIRKVSNVKTKQKIVSFPTPAEPFQVWQVDLCGPFPISKSGNSYIFTAVDMFSKFLFACPLRTNDAITVCQAIFQLFTHFGVCQTLISDQGSEFISKCTAELCRLLEVTHEFTPSFAHHCLGACERQHRTLAERVTTHVMKGKQWEEAISSVVFSMNSSVNSSLDYSPFEIVYGKRPSFPLSTVKYDANAKDIPPNVQTYMHEITQKIHQIRDIVKENSELSGLKMEERENQIIHPLKLSIGDYVYLHKEPVGPGRKLQPIFSGPYVVTQKHSNHLVKLRDPSGNKKFRRPIHINRLKKAHIRIPNPTHCFRQNNTEESNNSVSSEH